MELVSGAMVTKGIRLIEPLGEGAMGSVWRAMHLSLETEVAIKFIADELAGDESVMERFELEARSAAKIRSPHVVQTLDLGVTEDGTSYIVLELLRGNDLNEWLGLTGPMKPMLVGQLVSQVAKVLAKAHQMGIVHRDIKPDNLFLMDDDDLLVDEIFVKVLDFGIAKQIQVQRMSKITLPGIVLGTPPYMSPENMMGGTSADPEADLWALAVVAYEALTGELPFPSETIAQLLGNIVTGEMAPPSTLRDDVPPELDAWFRRALDHDRKVRFASAKEMAEAWNQAMATAAKMGTIHRSTIPSMPQSTNDTRVGPPKAPARGKLPSTSKVIVGGLVAGVTLTVGVALLLRALDAPDGSVEASAPAAPAASDPVIAVAMASAEMVRVAGGEFWIGCSGRSCRGNEQPKRRMSLEEFAIGKTEVAVADYAQCVASGGCTDQGISSYGTRNGPATESDKCNWRQAGRDQHPMNCVSWRQASAYCAWTGARLPTELEWEQAARGPDGRSYPWGNQAANCRFTVMADGGSGCGRDETWPVGFLVLGASPYGAMDMAGNVWEWVQDRYRASSKGAKAAASGPPEALRVIRGGCYQNRIASYVRTSTRVEIDMDERRVAVGFRCAGPLELAAKERRSDR